MSVLFVCKSLSQYIQQTVHCENYEREVKQFVFKMEIKLSQVFMTATLMTARLIDIVIISLF